MTLPRTFSKTKFWHNACYYYLCFKISKNNRIKKRGFMGSLGTCIGKDCFCSEAISAKTQHREETISWQNAIAFPNKFVKELERGLWCHKLYLQFHKKHPKKQKPFSFTALPHSLLDITTQVSLLSVKFNKLCLLYHFFQSRQLHSISGIYVC